jgi:DHA2 family multidrug resistance protein
VIHLFTARAPFMPPQMFRDRNFLSAMALMFVTGAVLLASSALLPPYLQNLSGYSVTDAGLLMAPRGLGTMASMMVAGTAVYRVDPRILMTFGIASLVWSMWEMSRWTPEVSVTTLTYVTVIQGFGMGFMFVPLNMTAFATLSPSMRTDGAALMNLMRNIGSAIGVSVTTTVQSNSAQTIHDQLSHFASPFNRALAQNAPSMMMNPNLPFGAAALNGMIELRAQIEAFANAFLFMAFISVPAFFVVWVMRRPQFVPGVQQKIEVTE